MSILFLSLLIFGGPPSDNIQITVHTDKRVYCEGEPIGIIITINNLGLNNLYLLDDYPLYSITGGGILFDTAAVGLSPSPWLKEYDPPDTVHERAVDIASIPPKRKWPIVVYLQRFVKQPKPGVYEIPYRLVLPFKAASDSQAESGNTISEAKLSDFLGTKPKEIGVTHGILKISIKSCSLIELKKVFDYLEAKLRTSGNNDREALEGLCVASNPAVIPYLVKLVEAGKTLEGCRALAHFRDDLRAQDAIKRAKEAIKTGSIKPHIPK